MKDITLKITGKQYMADKEEDQIEFVTDGKIYNKDGALYVVYEESEISGMEGSKTTLKVANGSVKMKRYGEMGFGTELYFEEGKRFNSTYDTPYGKVDVEVLTKQIKNDLNEESLKGKIDIEYAISLDGLMESKNRLTIDVM